MVLLLLGCAPPADTDVPVSAEVCDNGDDDDGDGLLDCEDGDCWDDCGAELSLESGELVSTTLLTGWSSDAAHCDVVPTYQDAVVVYEARDLTGRLQVHGQSCAWAVQSAVFSGAFSLYGTWETQTVRLQERWVEPGCDVEPWLPTHLAGTRGGFRTLDGDFAWRHWYVHTSSAQSWSSRDPECWPRDTAGVSVSGERTLVVDGSLKPMEQMAWPR